MENEEIIKALSGKTDLSEVLISTIELAIKCLEDQESNPVFRRGGAQLLNRTLPLLYQSGNEELFKRGCDVIMYQFPTEKDIEIKESIALTLAQSIDSNIKNEEPDLFKEVLFFFFNYRDDEDFGQELRTYALEMALID